MRILLAPLVEELGHESHCGFRPQDGIEKKKRTQPRIMGDFHWLYQSILLSSQRNTLEILKKVRHPAKIHSIHHWPTSHHRTNLHRWRRSRDWINNWSKTRLCFRPNSFYCIHGCSHKYMETKRGHLTLPLQIKTRLHHHRTTSQYRKWCGGIGHDRISICRRCCLSLPIQRNCWTRHSPNHETLRWMGNGSSLWDHQNPRRKRQNIKNWVAFRRKPSHTKLINLSPIFLEEGLFITVVNKFCYLGSIINHNLRESEDVENRTKKASQAFGALRRRVFTSKSTSFNVKKAVYTALILSVLLHGA